MSYLKKEEKPARAASGCRASDHGRSWRFSKQTRHPYPADDAEIEAIKQSLAKLSRQLDQKLTTRSSLESAAEETLRISRELDRLILRYQNSTNKS